MQSQATKHPAVHTSEIVGVFMLKALIYLLVTRVAKCKLTHVSLEANNIHSSDTNRYMQAHTLEETCEPKGMQKFHVAITLSL